MYAKRKMPSGSQSPVTSSDPPEPMSHLHVLVPLEGHTRARIAAMQSGISFKLYMSTLLMSAKPLNIKTDPAPSESGILPE